MLMLLGLIMISSFILLSCNGVTTNPLLVEARKNVEINQSEDFYFGKAWEYIKNDGEDSWDAVANLEKAIEINPSRAEYYSDMANCYRGGFKDFKTALEYYNKAIEKGFDKSFVFYNRSICKFETSDLLGACSDYQTAISNGWSDDYYFIATKAKCAKESSIQSKIPVVISYSQAESFMQKQCRDVGQTLTNGKTVYFNGSKLYMFLSVAENGYVCISSVSEYSLEILAADCGPSEIKIEQWNAAN